ncbi:hypothetical protein LINGRAHAP2_LOCUS36954, partial [Linum grandiflorum]
HNYTYKNREKRKCLLRGNIRRRGTRRRQNNRLPLSLGDPPKQFLITSHSEPSRQLSTLHSLHHRAPAHQKQRPILTGRSREPEELHGPSP